MAGLSFPRCKGNVEGTEDVLKGSCVLMRVKGTVRSRQGLTCCLLKRVAGVQAGKAMMGAFERREAEKRDAERAKNDLEAYIISTGGVLNDGTYDEVSRAFSPFARKPFYQLPVESTPRFSGRRSGLHDGQLSASRWGQ